MLVLSKAGHPRRDRCSRTAAPLNRFAPRADPARAGIRGQIGSWITGRRLQARRAGFRRAP